MRLSPSFVARLLPAVVSVGLVLVTSTRPALAESRPVPSAPVQRADGTTVDLASLAVAGPWLLVSVTAEAPVTGRLLQALESWQLGATGSRIVLLVDGTPVQVGRVETQWAARLPGVQFVADDRGEARRALQVRALPTVVGGRDGMVAWQVAGVLNDPGMLRSVVQSWLTSGAEP